MKRVGHGVYRIKHYVPTALDNYAEAVALVGTGAYIYGESVLAMHNLAYANPSVIYIASPKTVRKNLPPYVKLVRGEYGAAVRYEGIPAQRLEDAIISCKAAVMTERLDNAVNEAVMNGLMTESEASLVRENLYKYER